MSTANNSDTDSQGLTNLVAIAREVQALVEKTPLLPEDVGKYLVFSKGYKFYALCHPAEAPAVLRKMAAEGVIVEGWHTVLPSDIKHRT